MRAVPVSLRMIVGGVFLFVPIFLSSEAIPRFVYGLRIESAYRLVQSTVLEGRASSLSARIAAEKFQDPPDGDGDDLAQAAEFMLLSSPNSSAALVRAHALLLVALGGAPTNPRAWMLLCQSELPLAPTDIVRCLDTGFLIARYDWFTNPQNMRLIALEWPLLDGPLRDEAVSLIIPMWNTTELMWNTPQWIDGPTLRYTLYDLSRSSNGRQLLRAGFLADPDALRSFNRFVIRGRWSGH